MEIKLDDRLISVIVPVYKAENTLKKCADSILSQTHQNLQLILINDGSPDNSGALCDAYAAQDARVLVKHTVNQGVSAARNEGIRLASGEYIAFVDSDDWVEKDFLASALQDITREQADLYISGLLEETFKDSVMVSSEQNKGKDQTYTAKQLLNAFNEDYAFLLICGIWCKLYKASIIRERQILFDTSTTLGEDMLFICDYLRHAERVVFSGRVFYHYFRGNPDSLFSRYYPNMFEINIPLYEKMLALMEYLGCEQKSVKRMEGIYVRVLVGCIYHEFSYCSKSSPASRLQVIKKVAQNSYVKRCPLSNYRHPKDIILIVLLKVGMTSVINHLFTRHYCKDAM